MENLRLLAHSLALYSSTSLPEALRMTQSEADAFFEGKAFADWRKGEEQKLKLQAAVNDRLNSVIRSCGGIIKTVASLGRR